MDRRGFLTHSLVGAGIVVGMSKLNLPAVAVEEASKKEAVLKLCSQEWIVPGRSVKEKAENILKWGGHGRNSAEWTSGVLNKFGGNWKGAGACAALCWGSHHGDSSSQDLGNCHDGINDLKKVLEAAGTLGATGVIWVPCFKGESRLLGTISRQPTRMGRQARLQDRFYRQTYPALAARS